MYTFPFQATTSRVRLGRSAGVFRFGSVDGVVGTHGEPGKRRIGISYSNQVIQSEHEVFHYSYLQVQTGSFMQCLCFGCRRNTNAYHASV